MRHLSFFLITLSLVVHFGGVTYGEIYKWVDKNGVAHFGDAPPQNAGAIGKIESMPAVPRKDPASEVIPAEEAKPQAMKRPAKQLPPQEEIAPVVTDANVEMFATKWCGYCKKAREFFEARGIPLIEYDIEADPVAAQRKQEILASPGVPLVVINGKPIQGFAPQAYEQALRSQ
jgi:glutaredoxin